MTLDQLRYFVAAARLQHVGKAAKATHISPSAVSSAIAAIEEELGVSVFERRGKGIVLNHHGRRLQAWAVGILQQFDSVQARFTGEQSLAGTYRIGASHYLASQVLARSWTALQAAHEGLVGSLRAMDTSTVITELLGGHLDAGVCFSPQPHPQLELRTLHSGQLLLAVRDDHPLLGIDEGTRLAELAAYPMVMHKGRPGVDTCETHPIFAAHGITPRVETHFDDDHIAVSHIQASDAWSLLPDLVVEGSGGVRELTRPAGWDAPYTVALAYYPGGTPEHFIGALERALGATLAFLSPKKR